MDRAEVAGLGVALAGHAALLVLLTLGLASAIRPPIASNPIEVSFVEEVGLTSAAPEPTQAPPEQGMAPLAGPPEDAVASLPEPAPPAPQALPEPAPQPEPRPTPPPAPTPAPKQKASPPRQRQAQTSPPRQRQAPTPPTAQRPSQSRQPRANGSAQADRRPRLGRDLLKGLGSDPAPASTPRPAAAMTGQARASINSAIRRALLPCQRQNLPAPEAAEIQVLVDVTLNRDGSLAAANVRRVINSDPELERYERRMRDLALNVIRQCTPIRGLPSDLYDVPRGWRQFPYTFDARQS